MTPAVTERVLGWDVLRGLCALGVAAYHLLYWQDVAALHTLGSYGVYLFFVLSGASLAYNYQGEIHGFRDVLHFLKTRFFRLAPLYWVACGIAFLVVLDVSQQPLSVLLRRLALNLSFAFGVHDPVLTALPVGGWSLGIEFFLYFAFPFMLPLLNRRALWMAAWLLLAALQWAWIVRTVGSPAGYAASSVAYHQLPAFGAYFFGGCVIGAARRTRDGAWPVALSLAVWAGMAALLLALNTHEQGAELVGWRGIVLFAACFAVVFASGQARVPRTLAPVAGWLGDITYGCYLLHPVFFFGFAWYVWPHLGAARRITDAPLAMRLAVFAGVLLATCVTAWASERWFEQPVRRWGARRLARRQAPAPAAHIDAASISS